MKPPWGFLPDRAAGVGVLFKKSCGVFYLAWCGQAISFIRDDLLVVDGFTVRCYGGSPP